MSLDELSPRRVAEAFLDAVDATDAERTHDRLDDLTLEASVGRVIRLARAANLLAYIPPARLRAALFADRPGVAIMRSAVDAVPARDRKAASRALEAAAARGELGQGFLEDE